MKCCEFVRRQTFSERLARAMLWSFKWLTAIVNKGWLTTEYATATYNYKFRNFPHFHLPYQFSIIDKHTPDRWQLRIPGDLQDYITYIIDSLVGPCGQKCLCDYTMGLVSTGLKHRNSSQLRCTLPDNHKSNVWHFLIYGGDCKGKELPGFLCGKRHLEN